MINIIFFSKFREQMGLSSLSFDSTNIVSVADLIAALRLGYPLTTDFLTQNNLLIAVNQELATAQTLIKTGDEVAFFPPVTGG